MRYLQEIHWTALTFIQKGMEIFVFALHCKEIEFQIGKGILM